MIRPPAPGSFRFIWGVPIVLAALIVFGLLAALLGTGVWHGLSWIAMAIPILVGGYYCLRPARRPVTARRTEHDPRS